ncbi:hypothetical protein RIF29_20957 [Crotalaria pallida]|uniref:Uncharacterized protein n=1 Tax=Crotalaria pallida TaxID=3830 RepID=A0AAN9F210_CROPI
MGNALKDDKGKRLLVEALELSGISPSQTHTPKARERAKTDTQVRAIWFISIDLITIRDNNDVIFKNLEQQQQLASLPFQQVQVVVAVVTDYVQQPSLGWPCFLCHPSSRRLLNHRLSLPFLEALFRKP